MTYLFDNDTVVQCKKCGRKEHLKFANGIKNGWSKCHGETMPIIRTKGNIQEIIKETIQKAWKMSKLPITNITGKKI